jgi:phosphoglycolate phosphatase-like HAD superfamily hydrolase
VDGYPAGVFVVIKDGTDGEIGVVLGGGDFMEELEDTFDLVFLAWQGLASVSFLLRCGDIINWHDIFITLDVNRVFVDKAIIVDIDGTVVDTSERLAYVLSKAPLGSHDFYRIFLSGQLFHMDKPLPRARECLLEMAKTNHIIYLSGRRAGTEEETRKQLESGGFPKGDIHLRRSGKTLDFKTEKVRELAKKFDIVCAIGDTPEDIVAYQAAGVKDTRLVLTNMDWIDCPCEGDKHG